MEDTPPAKEASKSAQDEAGETKKDVTASTSSKMHPSNDVEDKPPAMQDEANAEGPTRELQANVPAEKRQQTDNNENSEAIVSEEASKPGTSKLAGQRSDDSTQAPPQSDNIDATIFHVLQRNRKIYQFEDNEIKGKALSSTSEKGNPRNAFFYL